MRELFRKVLRSTVRLARTERFHPPGSLNALPALLVSTSRTREVKGVPIAKLGPTNRLLDRHRALLAPLAGHRAARAGANATNVRMESTRVPQTLSAAPSVLQASALKIHQRPSAMLVPRGSSSFARGKGTASTAKAESTRRTMGASLARTALWGTTPNPCRRLAS